MKYQEKKWGTKYQALTALSEGKHQALTLSLEGRKKGEKLNKWREKEGFYSNFKHDEAAIEDNSF